MVRGKISCIWSLMFILLIFQGVSIGDIIYVDDDTPGGSGQSWDTAYKYLQDALAVAEAGDEVRVAQGTYRPDRDSTNPAGTGDRKATFELRSGMTLKGGYAGLTGVNPNAWDVTLYETILSGDLADDDELVEDPCDFVPQVNEGNWSRPDRWCLLIESTRIENSLHVVKFEGDELASVDIEGVTITAGNAFSPPYYWVRSPVYPTDDDIGGGILHRGGRITLTSIRIVHNSAIWGGGIYSHKADRLTATECSFVENMDYFGGGATRFTGVAEVDVRDAILKDNTSWAGSPAMDCKDCGVNFIKSSFEGNKGTTAAIKLWNCVGSLSDCSFVSNRLGGLYSQRCELVLSDCLFLYNEASRGAGIDLSDFSRTELSNCIFVMNKAVRGAAIYASRSSAEINHCNFVGNSAIEYGGVVCGWNSSLLVSNCILLQNRSSDGNYIRLVGPSPSSIKISYSLLDLDQSSISVDSNSALDWGAGNLEDDPCFVGPGYWDANGTPDDVNDDIFVAGDCHLKSQAGHWDSVSHTWITDDVTSPCIDAGDPNSPIGLEPFPNGGRVNMGAYGGTCEASKSYFGEPICETIIAGDINGDCLVNFLDLAIIASHWLEAEVPYLNQEN